jgi:hypothetical protein
MQASSEERLTFLSALRAVRTELRCAVVYTLRADFSGALMESRYGPSVPCNCRGST